ncbi:hypothetical protein DRH29_04380 [candidate division Kazan bacterium]|uniref:Sulfotransferase domain-containing protein n=1 Tax=candidate division Kazan bacterium TaxID=2202143 RepID=A0A420ZBQ6_UNCK3|nr:MAG: hypothetical protein DRH29_04380 [candidate division Kazan bacterium]
MYSCPKEKRLTFLVIFIRITIIKGISWYSNFFIYSNEEKIKGEITPEYLLDDKEPIRIERNLGQIKFLVVVRNPVQRAFSAYKKGLREGDWNCSFDNFIKGSISKTVMEYIDGSPYTIVLSKNTGGEP